MSKNNLGWTRQQQLNEWYCDDAPAANQTPQPAPALTPEQQTLSTEMQNVSEDIYATPQEKMQARSIWARLVGKA